MNKREAVIDAVEHGMRAWAEERSMRLMDRRIAFSLPDEDVDRLARHLCHCRNEEPQGSIVSFCDGEMHSVTFFDKSKRDVRVMLDWLATHRFALTTGGDRG